MSLFKHCGRLIAVALLAGTVTGMTTSAAPADEADAPAAATWLAAQATDGGFGAPGLTADAIFAFVSADVGSAVTAAAIDHLDDAELLSSYVGNPSDGYQAAPTAKILLAARAAGAGSQLGGIDLAAELRALEGDDGRFSGGYTSLVGQALAVTALAGTEDGVSAAAVAAVVRQQCDTGGFALSFDSGGCEGDVDVTGYVASALQAANETVAAAAALDWLESVQHESGGFVAGFPGAPENANSTGMAGQALSTGGRDAAAATAAAFIKGLQVGCDGPADEQGGIAYDDSGFNAGVAVMATAQAIPALTGEGLAELDSTDDSAELPGIDCLGTSVGMGLTESAEVGGDVVA